MRRKMCLVMISLFSTLTFISVSMAYTIKVHNPTPYAAGIGLKLCKVRGNIQKAAALPFTTHEFHTGGWCPLGIGGFLIISPTEEIEFKKRALLGCSDHCVYIFADHELDANGQLQFIAKIQGGHPDKRYTQWWSWVESVAAGNNFSLGLLANRTVLSTGFGCGITDQIQEWRDIVKVVAGSKHAVGLTAAGKVVAVGDNGRGQCQVDEWRDFVIEDIAAGNAHTLGLTAGKVLAVGDFNDDRANVRHWGNIIKIAAGEKHSVGLRRDGTVVATGRNDKGQLDTLHWRDIIDIAAGNEHTVGLKSDGTIVVTGQIQEGQHDVAAWKNIKKICAGNRHTVGLLKDGTVVAVGDNSEGQCDIADWKQIVDIAAGREHTLGVTEAGNVISTKKSK